MSKLTFKEYFRVYLGWCWLALRFKRLRFIALEPDQKLLFEGAAFRLIWQIEGAYRVKLFIGDKKVAAFLPERVPLIPTGYAGELRVRACGVFGCEEKTLSLPVRSFIYREAPVLLLKRSFPAQPAMVNGLLIRLAYRQPVAPQPSVITPGITLEGPLMKREEEMLQNRILLFQDQMTVNS
ncbi:hypothetical protein [Mucilaginibacter ginsenosidivorans]|uniref:Uncharacterized protein n=1 Tax=Mucilaginibacter ginsenosidivorans TaxID=398053 RepID=A0A5B8UTY5_9SPHI|nr:hypothetical protein [Mucilaginibacter ginsenosidivorans]QEC62504.1 hypothetical protein FRZ54_07850 [Mucilaginibacter ginsenosidivorans]